MVLLLLNVKRIKETLLYCFVILQWLKYIALSQIKMKISCLLKIKVKYGKEKISGKCE